jgi:hypothetical protein
MRALSIRVLGLASSIAGLTAGGHATDLRAERSAAGVAASPSLARPRMHFEPTTEDGRFVARGAGYSLYLGPTQSVLLISPEKPTRQGRLTPPPRAAVSMKLDGATAGGRADASEPLPGKSHYFHGADRSAWRRDVAHFGRVTYRQVYPGTDLTFYGHEGALEYDFVVSPGADPERIRFLVEGATSVRVDTGGDLVLATPMGEVRQRAPVAYQSATGGERVAVACQYVLRDGRQVGFEIGPHDARLPLVIDPVLSYSTFVGGIARDDGQDVTIAPDGTLWYVGTTFSSDVPSAVNGASGDEDAFVSHFTADGRTLLSTTYVGGASADFANRAKATATGVLLVGGTVSADFPRPDAVCAACRNPPPGLQPWELFNPPSDSQGFLVKLDAAGALVHAAVFGGDRLDNAWVLGLDGAGRPYVGSGSCGDGFPTTPGAYKAARSPAADASDPNNECDVTVARFSEAAGGFALDYGTYLGGSAADFVSGLAVTARGAAWVVGGTTSGDFPTTSGAGQATNAGGYDAFVARIAPGGGTLPYSTFFGGSAYDYPFDVALDGAGGVHVAGRTESTDFPTTTGAFQEAARGGSDGWVARFSSSGSLAWCTRLGGSGFDWPFAIAVAPGGSSYVAGFTESPDFPTRLPAQQGPGGDADAFVSRLSPSGSRLTWSTYLGGPGWDGSHGLALEGGGGLWVAGTTSGGLAATIDAAQPDFGGAADGFLVFLDESASVRVGPDRMTFAPTRVGRTRGPRQVRVVNDGSVPVDVLGLELGGANPSDYDFSSGCPETLDPGESCRIGVTFAPTAAGARGATLLVDTAAAAAPVSVALNGDAFVR